MPENTLNIILSGQIDLIINGYVRDLMPMENLIELWKKYNQYTEKISIELGRTNNVVGEFAEYLVNLYLEGTLLKISGSGADIQANDGKLYQVKSRKIKNNNLATQLNVIRSWDFDYLVVVLFNQRGEVIKAINAPRDVAKEYGKRNTHQNGWVITTSSRFFNDKRNSDITSHLALITA
jgi:hypothetical protein